MGTWAKLARAGARYVREQERQRQRAIRATAQAARAVERAERAAEREQARLEREGARQAREQARQDKAAYLAARKADADDRSREVAQELVDLESILVATLSIDDAIAFEQLYPEVRFVAPDLPPVAVPTKPDRAQYFQGVEEPPGVMERLFGFGRDRRLAAQEAAETQYQEAMRAYAERVAAAEQQAQEHQTQIDQARAQWEREVAEQRAEIERFRQAYEAGDPEAIDAYCAMVLERSDYSPDVPQRFDLAYNPDSHELVVQYQLPTLDIVPAAKEYRYVQTGDRIVETPLKPKERTTVYERAVAQIALRTLHELFEADRGNHIASVVFNGIVHTTDPRTGQDIQPCLVTVQTTKDQFAQFDLGRVDPIACLKGLRAHVSPAVGELAPVKPIVDFNMLDKRFVTEQDVLSELDTRSNIYEMDPFDFEHLICNLFSKIGLESRLTRSSRDGGIDVVAFDPRPVFGGKYVIQAKRYRNTVDVSAVRDLYGSMMNENAAKGILVTTSSFGPDARAFAKDKPIELIDGQNLLYLLAEQGIQAKIEFPQ
jgi:restriction system protein